MTKNSCPKCKNSKNVLEILVSKPFFCHCKIGRLVSKIGVYVVSFVENVKKLKKKKNYKN